jgi:hypothetical protein
VRGSGHLGGNVSGRFQNAEAERFYNLTLHGFHEEELGTSESFGWFAYFTVEGVILQVDSLGFVWLTEHQSYGLAAMAWGELTKQWLEFSTEDYYGEQSEPYDWETQGF